MKAYKVTRTIKQEFIAFGNNKEEAIDNSYSMEGYDFKFLNNDNVYQGAVIGGSATAKVVNDTVTVAITDGYTADYEYGQRAEMLELINQGANILERSSYNHEETLKPIQREEE